MTLKIRILVKYIVLLTFEFKALPKYHDLLVWFNSLSSENTDVYILVMFLWFEAISFFAIYKNICGRV